MKCCMNYVLYNLFLTSPLLEGNWTRMEMLLQLKYLPQISTFCDVLTVQSYYQLNFDYGLKHNGAALMWCNLSWHMISDEILLQQEVEVGQYHKQLFGQQLHGSIAPASSELWDIIKARIIWIHILCNTMKMVYSKSESLSKLPFVHIMYTRESKNEKSMVGSVACEEVKQSYSSNQTKFIHHVTLHT